MKNYVQRGDTLTLTAPYARTSGQAMKVGTIIAICTADAGNGATVEASVEGVFDVAKVSAQAWTLGAPIFWDDSAKLFTTVSTSNTLAGVAVAAAANPSGTGRVRLNGTFS